MSGRGELSGEIRVIEAWFHRHGLPWFVDDVRDAVARRLRWGHLAGVVVLGLIVGAIAGGVTAAITGDGSTVGPAAASGLLVVLAVYALTALRAWVIAAWAVRRAFGSLRLLVPLATRALPMLLLFVTFLFINAEVWQVASALKGGVLWGSVLFFGLAAVGFLVPRLAEELDDFDDTMDPDALVAAATGTPLEKQARRLVGDAVELPERAQVTGLQMVNLVVVLVIAQAAQVLLLSLAIFCFFLVFGAVAIEDSVIVSWIGHAPDYPLPGPELVSVELTHVAVFLAAFSGLYFTVVAITDELYRKQFFGVIMDELARAVAARVVYRELRGSTEDR